MRNIGIKLGVPYVVSKISKSLLAVLTENRIMSRRDLEEKFSLKVDCGSNEQRVAFDYISSVEFFEPADFHGRSIRVVLGTVIADWFQDAILVIHPNDRPNYPGPRTAITGTIVFYPYTISAQLKGELPDINYLAQAITLVIHRDNINVWWDDKSLRRELERHFKINDIPEDGGAALLKRIYELGIARQSSGCNSWKADMDQDVFEAKFHTRLPSIPR